MFVVNWIKITLVYQTIHLILSRLSFCSFLFANFFFPILCHHCCRLCLWLLAACIVYTSIKLQMHGCVKQYLAIHTNTYKALLPRLWVPFTYLCVYLCASHTKHTYRFTESSILIRLPLLFQLRRFHPSIQFNETHRTHSARWSINRISIKKKTNNNNNNNNDSILSKCVKWSISLIF